MDKMETDPSAIEQKPSIIKVIGNTTIEIYTHFSDSNKENFTDKVVRLIKNEGARKRECPNSRLYDII